MVFRRALRRRRFPYRRRSFRRSYRRRRPSRRMFRRRGTYTRPYGSRIGPPNRVVVNLVYVEQFKLSITAGGVYVYHTMHSNDCHNPDYTSVTDHQPRFWDQYKAMYDRYCVIGSVCSVSFINGSNNTGENAVVGIMPSDEQTPTTSTTEYNILEQPGVKYRTLCTGNGAGRATITSKMNPNKVLHQRNPVSPISPTTAFTTVSPSLHAYFHIFAMAGDTLYTGGGYEIDCTVRMQYRVVLFDLSKPGAS